LLVDDERAIQLTRGRGYQLVMQDSQLDAKVFERHVETGKQCLTSGDPERAIGELSGGLALWRGSADWKTSTYSPHAGPGPDVPRGSVSRTWPSLPSFVPANCSVDAEAELAFSFRRH
jgi:hypothetical protein